MNLIFIDIETTGLDPEHCRITELALLFSNGFEITSRKTYLFNPECRIPEMITNLTGISNDLVKDKPKFYEHAKEIVELTEGARLIGHNVRFDYSFLAAEFRRLGFRFQRDHGCTLSLTRKHVPGLPSYGLKKVCESLNVARPDLLARTHRAETDAELSFELFRQIYGFSGSKNLEEFFKAEARPRHLPPLMKAEDIEALPRTHGVYYFYDEHDTLLYVGKSINIHDRVISHFQADLREEKERRMKERVSRIRTETTPTELAALLLEAEEIKRLKPLYNRMLRETKHSVGLYLDRGGSTLDRGRSTLAGGGNEPYRFYIQAHRQFPDANDDNVEAPIRLFKTRKAADNYLSWICEEHKFCENFCYRGAKPGGHKLHRPRACFGRQIERCLGVCDGSESVTSYNSRIENFVTERQKNDPENYLLCEKVKGKGEWFVVWVDRGNYRGCGLYKGRLSAKSAYSALSVIEAKSDNSDVYRILKQYRLQDTQLKIYPLGAAPCRAVQTSLYQAS